MNAASAEDSYDYVIVGGGTAGCVLANRLSADPQMRVCLIEAGPEPNSALIDIPIGIMALITDRRFNWCANSVPQAGAANRKIYIPHGRVLGGGSAINGMVYMRGDALDYDGWAAAGNPGWSYAEVLPYFLRSENNRSWTGSPWHGTDGELDVADMRGVNPAAYAFLEAASDAQIPQTDDFSRPHPFGSGLRQVTQRRGRRVSAVGAFLDPVRRRPNLTVRTGALADRILLDGRRATGVHVRLDGDWRVVGARRAVVVTAGALRTPAILQRSGIGQAAALAAAGIAPVHDLPGVGANLQDHHTAAVMHRSRSRTPYGLSWGAFPRLAWSALSYLVARRGLLASNASEAAALVRSVPEAPTADLQLSFVSGRRGATLRPDQWGHGYGITAIALHPRSRGLVKVTTADPDTCPAIDFGAFSKPEDLETLVYGLRLARQILEGTPFGRFGGTEAAPGALIADDAGLRDYIRATSGTAFHPAGTCAMGRGPDAVVDAELAVHGIEGLRIADASIMPEIVGGNTNAPVIMIAEKAADLILGRAPPSPIALS